jgi:ferredoxin
MPTVSVKKVNDDGTPSTENDAQLDCPSGSVLWEALDAKGHQLPHGCLSGSCTACRIEVLSGEENLSPLGPTEASTIERYKTNYQMRPNAVSLEGKTLRLSCQAKIEGEGDIEIAPFG